MFGVDRRGLAAARRLDQDQAGRPDVPHPTTDPYATAWLGRLHASTFGPRDEIGTIVDVLPGGYAYLVSAGPQSFLWASPGGATGGFGITGGRPLTTYALGQVVRFSRHPETPAQGTIVGVEPHWSYSTVNQPADGIWPVVRSGSKVEPAHQQILINSLAAAAEAEIPLAGIDGADFAAGRPIDATSVGEWGVMAETGVGVFADPFQAYLRADEETGVFAFYPDQMLRLAGHNVQTASTLSEREELDDEGEITGFRRVCAYPWEAYGLWRWNQITPGWETPVVPNHGLGAGQGVGLQDPLAVQGGSGRAVREPDYPNQIPAARMYEWEGYLGQGGRRVTALPAQLWWSYPTVPASARVADVRRIDEAPEGDDEPLDAPSGRLTVNGSIGPAEQPYAVPPNTRGYPGSVEKPYGSYTGPDAPDQPGVFEEQRTLTGGVHTRSAKRIILSKRPNVPVPRPVRRPEDPAGDCAPDYSASGLGLPGGFPTHKLVAELPAAAGPAQRMSMLPDVLAYAFNWEGLHPFAYHDRDWFVAQEGATGSPVVNQQPPDYQLLAAQQYLRAPTPVSLDVDHRYNVSKVYENESSVSLLEDGTIVLADGWGSEIRMGGGNIELRCSGDIFLAPGRNLVGWAGHDVALRAHDSVDLTAANGDLRTKAERNSHHLAGNSTCGGFLFESKARCAIYEFEDRIGERVASSGFTVLCPTSEFLVVAEDAAIVLSDEAPEDARIVFDAGLERSVSTVSKNHTIRVGPEGSVVHLFDSSPGRAASANEFTATYSAFGADVNAYGSVFSNHCVTAAEWLIAGNHVATVNAGAFSGLVDAYTAGLGLTGSQLSTRMMYLNIGYRSQYGDQDFYPTGADFAEFTLRDDDQYRTDDYEYWESRWQTIAEASVQDLPVWLEPAVTGLRSGAITRPHPGNDRWTNASTYRYYVPSLVDTADGWIAVSRDDPLTRPLYETGVLAPPGQAQLSSNLRVSVPSGVET